MSKRRRRNTISGEEIKSVMHLPQYLAAENLGISVTTLKKRYRELMPGVRWPYRPYNHYKKNVERNDTNGIDRRMTLQFICNMKNQNPTNNVKRTWERHINNLHGVVKKKQRGKNRMVDEDEDE